MIAASVRIITRYRYAHWALADQALVSGVNFVTGIVLARFLGLAEYGVFTLIWSGVLMANGFQMAFILSPMITMGPKLPDEEKPYYFGAVLAQQLMFSILVFVLIILGMVVVALFVPAWPWSKVLFPLAAVSFAFQLQDFLRRYYFARQAGHSAFINDAISYLGQLLLVWWCANNVQLDSSRVLWIIAVTSGIAVLFGIPRLNALVFDLDTLYSTIRKNWQFSKWLIASVVLQWLSGNIFLFGAGAWVNMTAVGALKAAQNIMGVAHILFQGFENFVPVQAAKCLSQDGFLALRNFFLKTTLLGLLGTGAIALIFGLAPTFWMEQFYDANVATFGYLLVWYAAIYPVVFLSLMLRTWFRTFENTWPIFFSYALMSVAGFVVVYPFTQLFGISGIMAGILATNLVMVTSLLFFEKKRTGPLHV